MNFLDKIIAEGVQINLVQTNAFLLNLYSNKKFEIQSDYPTINSIGCTLKKDERCFKYSAEDILLKGPPVKYQHKQYGYSEPFKLVNKEFNLSVYKGAGQINLGLLNLCSTGEIFELKSNSFGNKPAINRAIIPTPTFHKSPIAYIESQGFNVGSSTRVAGYINIKINNIKFGIFDYEVNDNNSLVIECYEKVASNLFENYVSAIVYCFGLISGHLFRNEITILSYKDSSFKNITGFHFKKLEDSLSGMPVIDPQLFWQLSKPKKDRPYLSKYVFQNLINKSLNDLRLFRAIKIISESAQYPIEIKASTYSVSLETVKNIIIEENEEKLNPFKTKKKASGTIKKLKRVVEEIPESEFNNKKMILNKLEQLNQIGNKDSLLLSFKLLKIALSEDDKRCINMRNDFLHGRIPFDSENDPKAYELHHIVYKLHLLVCSLILKYSGFNGLILNNIKLADLTHFNKKLDEPLFRRI